MQKYALITGASGGIGYDFAQILAQEQYNLVLVARNEKRLLEIKDDFEKRHSIQVLVLAKDLSEKDAAVEIHESVAKENISIDILINNAGFGDYGEFHKVDWQTQYEMVQVNIVALMQLTRLFLPAMIENKRGRILNVASGAAFLPGPFLSVYFATKAFVLSFSEALSRELKDTGVTVTTLCPGATKTGFEKRASLDSAQIFERFGDDSYSVAKYGYLAMMKGTPVAIYGLPLRLAVKGLRLIPRRVLREITYRILRK